MLPKHAINPRSARQPQPRGNTIDAELYYRQLLTRLPDHADALYALGRVCFDDGRRTDGINFIRRALITQPHNPDLHLTYATMLAITGRLAESVAASQQAIALRPDHPDSYNNLGVTLEKAGRFDEAVQAFAKATDLVPLHAGYRTHLGNALCKIGLFAEAEAAYRQALRLEAQHLPALRNLAILLQEQARHDEAIEIYRKAVAAAPGESGLNGLLLYSLHYLPGYSLQAVYDAHLNWADRHATPLTPALTPEFPNDCSLDRGLRIGYISPDFRRHSTATFVEPLLTQHDRAQFEIFLYSSVARPDDATTRFRALADQWREIASTPDEQVAQLIREDQIDILVDVTGHMTANRLLVFARKPAPIQVTYIGHPNTTGMKAMDYRITDQILDPPDCGSDQYNTERLVRLPRIVGCYQTPREEIAVGPLPAIQNGFVTFGCLNTPSKLTEPAIKLWCQILRKVKGSKLTLLAHPGSRHLYELFARYGIDANGGRILFKGRLSRQDYLQTFNRVDIALDCFPYNGHTTSCDGFWMGVPLVTLAGNSYVSRMGLSLLTNLNLTDWVADSPEAYVNIAVQKASNIHALEDLRQTLRERFESSPVTDYAALTRDLEQAFRKMWRDWCLSPKD